MGDVRVVLATLTAGVAMSAMVGALGVEDALMVLGCRTSRSACRPSSWSPPSGACRAGTRACRST